MDSYILSTFGVTELVVVDGGVVIPEPTPVPVSVSTGEIPNYKIIYNKIEFETPPDMDFYVYGLPSVNSLTMENVVLALPDDYEDVLNAYIDYWIASKQKLDTAPTLLQIAEQTAINKKRDIDTVLNIDYSSQGVYSDYNYSSNLSEDY